MAKFIGKLVMGLIIEIFGEFIMGLIDKFTAMLNNVFVLTAEVVKSDFVSKITNYSLKLGMALLIFMAVSQVLKLYVLPEGDDPENDFGGFFVRLGKSAILITFSTTIVNWGIKFSDYLASDLLSIVSGNIKIASKLNNVVTELITDTTLGFGSVLLMLLILLIVIICLLIVCVQAGLRGVNLAILQMFAPLFAVNYITTDKGLWNKWKQNLFSVSLTYVLQIVLVNISLKFIVNGFSNITSMLIGICWLIVCIQSPKLLKEFSYSSGVGSGISRSTSTVLQGIRFLK